jgi:transcriptional regulator GlxA family with amidase domain
MRGGFDLHVDDDLSWLSRADTIVVPGWCGSANPVGDDLAEALRRAHRRGARLVSFCTGAFALAGTGLLDGQRATTHWERAADLAERFPAIEVDPSVLYVEADRIYTSAGSAASIDLALHLVRLDFGAAVANHVARDLVVPPHRDGGQAQFIDRPMPRCGSAPMEELLRWMVEHLDQEHSVNELAARLHMSPRTFARRFRAETGATPAAWLNSQRVLRAQELLETTELNIDEIAREAGFGHSVLLRHHFTKVLDTSPQSYRRAFRGQLAEAI